MPARHAPFLAGALAIALCAGTAHAQLRTWIWNADASAPWNNARNWASTQGGFPDSGDAVAFFANAITANRTIEMPADFHVRQVIFKNTAGKNYTLGATNPGRLLFGGNSDNLIQVQSGDTGQQTLNCGIFLDGAGLTIDNSGAQDLKLKGVIDQAAGDPRTVTITGGTRVTFSAANTYKGDTNIAGGLLSISDPANLGNGAASKVAISAGTLEVTSTITIAKPIEIGGASATLISITPPGNDQTVATYSGVISGTAPLTIRGSARLSGVNTFTGDITARFPPGASPLPALFVSNNNALGNAANNLILGSAAFVFEAGFTCPRGLSGGGFLDTNGNNAEWSGVVSGQGSISKIGNGQLALSGDNSGFTGVFAANSGTLRITDARNLGQGDNVILSGGTLLADGNIRATQSILLTSASVGIGFGGIVSVPTGKTFSINSITNTSSSGSGQYPIEKKGDGTLTVRGNTADAFGRLTVSAGTVVLDGSITTASGVFVNAGTFAGSGRVRGQNFGWNIAAGAKIDAKGQPINPPGTASQEVGTLFSDANCSLDPGAIVQMDINAATGIAGASGGAAPGWDLQSITAQLLLSSSSGSPAIVQLNSLSSFDQPSALPDFNPLQPYAWEFLRTTAGILNFSPSSFAVDTSGFLNSYPGAFSVDQIGNSLYVEYSPVPAPATLTLFLPFVTHRRRRPPQCT